MFVMRSLDISECFYVLYSSLYLFYSINCADNVLSDNNASRQSSIVFIVYAMLETL